MTVPTVTTAATTQTSRPSGSFAVPEAVMQHQVSALSRR
jgi:hypothetical protein